MAVLPAEYKCAHVLYMHNFRRFADNLNGPPAVRRSTIDVKPGVFSSADRLIRGRALFSESPRPKAVSGLWRTAGGEATGSRDSGRNYTKIGTGRADGFRRTPANRL